MKRHLSHGFILMFVFLLAVGAILYSSELKFTGYDVSDETDTTTEETETTETTTTDTTSEDTTTTETTTTEETETTETTTTDTTSEDTTETTETTTTTENSDINITELSEETCTPNWQCETWSPCSSGTQTRTCTDANSCGSQEGIPELTQTCTYCGDGNCDGDENCNSCSSDCGECEEETTTDTSSDEEDESVEIHTTTLITNSVKTQTCTSNWTCGDWQECVNSVQIRVCTDENNCGSQEGIPTTTQSCVVEIKETCFDEIRNQDEEDIDCGGVCEKKCGFFTIVGSAVSGSIETGRKFVFEEMFGNVTRMIISIGSMVLLIGGFIAARFFFGKKRGMKKLDKAIDNLPGNKDSKEADSKDPKVEYYY